MNGGEAKSNRQKNVKTRNLKPETRNSKRRLFAVGPGILAALAIAAFVAAKNYAVFEKPPVVNKQVLLDTAEPLITPEVHFMLDHHKEIGLSKSQKETIMDISDRYNQDASPVKAALASASRNVSSYLNEKQEKGATLNDIQKHTEDFQKLSAHLSLLRKSSWNLALNVLSETQQKKVREALKQTKDFSPYLSVEGKKGETGNGQQQQD